MAELAEANDCHLRAGTGAPAAQRGVDRDSRAQQRSGLGQPDALRDGQDEVLVDDDVRGVAALGLGPVAVNRAVGQGGPLEAVLLLALAAASALTAGSDHAADSDAVAHGMPEDTWADRGDDAGELVTWDEAVGLRAPSAARMADVGVTHTAVPDLDEDVARSEVAALSGHRHERPGRGGRAVGVDGEHDYRFLVKNPVSLPATCGT